MNSTKNDFIKQGSILAVASILVRIIGMIYRIPMTAIIGDKGNGLYSYAYIIYTTLLLLSSYSLPLAVSKMVSAKAEMNQWKNVRKILHCAIAFAIVIGTVFALIVLLGAGFFTRFFFHSELAAIPLRFMAPTVLIMALVGVFRGFFQGLQNTRPTAVSQLLEQIVNAVISVLFAYLLFNFGSSIQSAYSNEDLGYAWGAAGGVIGTGAGAFTALVFCFLLFLGYRKVFYKKVRSDKSEQTQEYSVIFKLLLSIAVPVILSTALYNLIDLVDGAVFSSIMTSKGMGDVKDSIWGAYNGKALLMVHIPVSISSAMAVSLVPSLTAAYSTGKYKLAKSKVNATLRFTTIVAFPSATGLLILAVPIIKTLFRGDTSSAGSYLMIASAAVITFSISTITNSILQGIDRMRLPVIHSAIAMAVHIAILLLLCGVFNMGINGVIISYVIYGLTISILNFISISRILHYIPDIMEIFVKPLIASAVMGVVCFAVYKLLSLKLGMALPMIVSILVSVIVYFVFSVKTGILNEQALQSFPKGNAVVRLAKKYKLM